jgi:hypothetical protein
VPLRPHIYGWFKRFTCVLLTARASHVQSGGGLVPLRPHTQWYAEPRDRLGTEPNSGTEPRDCEARDCEANPEPRETVNPEPRGRR